jgi:hypothetical protein
VPTYWAKSAHLQRGHRFIAVSFLFDVCLFGVLVMTNKHIKFLAENNKKFLGPQIMS